jgi:hypothetical protein
MVFVSQKFFKLALASRVSHKKPNFCVFLHSFLRRLSANLNFAFAALSAEAGAASAAPTSDSISFLVNVFEKIRTHFKESC